ncbi:LIM domain protein [Oesophagostomum dentatum]|uniref:LIM domain protein n=1 Tax=Oesophagostomum dentatum TaxID=61180 RepID=A0A0B1TKT5_OESDE|nr:LIM domain protein [Oesophagostomum dentatum]
MEYYTAGNTVVCLDCHLDEVGLKCEGCGRAVYEEYLMVDGKQYHHDCFICARCRNPMPGGQYQVLNGRYFDEDCYYIMKYHLKTQRPAD